MTIFQKSVIKRHLDNLDKEQVEKAYQKFRENYSPAKIEEIKKLKEEEYQDGFLRDLFVDVFGYILKPDSNYNLAREFKNQGDGKKADGAILKNEKAVAIIELKSTKTKDLKSITDQAFNYKYNQPGCKYVITSNFQKIRFYIDHAIEFEEFDLFHLNKTDFELLYLILNTNSIFSDLPLKLKEETKFHEQEVSDKLYKDYSIFKSNLFENLITNNPNNDKLTLFNKSQKLLDRFLFILFAEDSGLLPPNSISRIIDTFHKLTELDAYKPIYDIYKQYFGYMNIGRKGKTNADNIPAYNGGLFYTDELLDNLKIDDSILIDDLLKLSEYDFNTEVDVNILGHIFEHSLSEIEEITAEIEGTTTDKTKSKRKKDGVFYTPKYITQYIVENTIGTLCNEKRKELEIEEIEFDGSYRAKDGKLLTKGKKLYQKLNDYKDWLLSLKIVDPACGSGAFLNQALNFLIAEHKNIDDIIAELTNTTLRLFDTDKAILENNLYGVDINEESVEIAKLSLWLRTAQKGRKLSSLNDNIKCGNSLIDDPEIAGEKAFDWNVEFEEIMQNGGFDVVIGNPPYLNMTLNNTDNNWLEYYINNYESVKRANSKNIYTLFNELSSKLIKDNSIVSFIIPEGFLKTRSYNDCVNAMENVGDIYSAIYFEDWVFEDATTGSMIFEFVKNPVKPKKFKEYFMNKNREISEIVVIENPVISKYEKSNFKSIDDYCDLFKGMAVKNRKEYISEIRNELPNVFLLGNCIDRYSITNSFYCNYEELTIVGGTKKIEKHNIAPRILIRRTGDFLCCVMLAEPALTESTLYSCSTKTDYIDLNYVLALLNSKVLTYIVRHKMITNEQAFPQIMLTDIKLLKIPFVDFDIQLKLGEKSKNIAKEQSLFLHKKNIFINYFQPKFNIEKLSRKLQNWHELEFVDFINELNKAIKKAGSQKITKKDEMEWMEVFEEKNAEAKTLKAEIEKTDKEIDQMVYELYGLNDEEIGVIENSV